MRTISAYTEEKNQGSLFDLLDASHWMGEKWELRNEDLPADFHDRVTGCRQECGSCPACRDMFERHGRRRPFHMPDFGNNMRMGPCIV